MTPRLTSAVYVDRFRIHLIFDDGVKGTVDLEEELWGEVFEPLKDVALFKSFKLNLELNTIVWCTGADFAPEFLYEKTIRAFGVAAAE